MKLQPIDAEPDPGGEAEVARLARNAARWRNAAFGFLASWFVTMFVGLFVWGMGTYTTRQRAPGLFLAVHYASFVGLVVAAVGRTRAVRRYNAGLLAHDPRLRGPRSPIVTP